MSPPSFSKPVKFRNPNSSCLPKLCYEPGRVLNSLLTFCMIPPYNGHRSPFWDPQSGQYLDSNPCLCSCDGIMVLLDEQVRWGIQLFPALGSTYHLHPVTFPSSPSILLSEQTKTLPQSWTQLMVPTPGLWFTLVSAWNALLPDSAFKNTLHLSPFPLDPALALF